MVRRERGGGSPSPLSPSKKQGAKVVSEDEVFSPEILPIEDRWEEKRIIEKRKIPYYEYLIRKLGTRSLGWTEGSLYNRVREVYRLCFESTKDVNVINDFVAYHPGLVFDTPWLAAVVHDHTVFEDPGKGSYRTRLLQALGHGFKRAAGHPSGKRWQKATWIESQRELMNSFAGMLRGSYKSGNWNLALGEWKKVEVPKRVDDLIRQHPLLKGASKDLKVHLEKRQFRKAARLIVFKLWGVNKRTLDGNPAN